jgi:DnaJ-class molecular chaperone
MEQKDFYDILGVKKDAGPKEIREAYRRLALLHHPDRNKGNPDAAARMKEINEAYAVLADPGKRQAYDGLRQAYGSSAYSQFRQAYSEKDIYRGSDIQEIFEELSRAFGFRGFDDVFKESYGPGYRTFEFRRPGAFGRVFVGGLGGRHPHGHRTGPTGDGSWLGKLVRYALKKKWGIELPEKGDDLEDVIVISPELARVGGKVQYTCRKRGKELIVTVPSNMRPGQQLRLKGMGGAGRGGGPAGDLYVTVRTRNPLFQKAKDLLSGIRSSLPSVRRK